MCIMGKLYCIWLFSNIYMYENRIIVFWCLDVVVCYLGLEFILLEK